MQSCLRRSFGRIAPGDRRLAARNAWRHETFPIVWMITADFDGERTPSSASRRFQPCEAAPSFGSALRARQVITAVLAKPKIMSAVSVIPEVNFGAVKG